MKTINESLEAFDLFLNTVSDEQLDQILSEVDATGITGPSVQDYLAGLNRNVSSFFEDTSEISTLEEVEYLFCDTDILQPVTCKPYEMRSNDTYLQAGENQYLMAA